MADRILGLEANHPYIVELERRWRSAVNENPQGILDVWLAHGTWEDPVLAIKNGWLDDLEAVEDPGPGYWDTNLDLRTNRSPPKARLVDHAGFTFRIRHDAPGRCPSGPCGNRVSVFRIQRKMEWADMPA